MESARAIDILRKAYRLRCTEAGASTDRWLPYVSPEKVSLELAEDSECFDFESLRQLASKETVNDGLLSSAEFLRRLEQAAQACQNPVAKTWAHKRLQYLQHSFKLHRLEDVMDDFMVDDDQARQNANRRLNSKCNFDHSSVTKIDTHIHLAAAMTEKGLLQFMRRKYIEEPDRVVYQGKTLREVFACLDIMCLEDLNLEKLGVRSIAGECAHRFDLFNEKYKPYGSDVLRTVFLKTDNEVSGEYLGQLLRECLLENDNKEAWELRVSIYGRSKSEWSKLARWIVDNGLCHPRIRFYIQMPRLFDRLFKGLNANRPEDNPFSFAEYTANVFEPVLECLVNPESDPLLYRLMLSGVIVGFDSVDDESNDDYDNHIGHLPHNNPANVTVVQTFTKTPHLWTEPTNPLYIYYLYWMHRWLSVINRVMTDRARHTKTDWSATAVDNDWLINHPTYDNVAVKMTGTVRAEKLAAPRRLVLVPHCGECPRNTLYNMLACYLLCDGMTHGVELRRYPVLLYLCYLRQLPINLSVLSNNYLYVPLAKSPLPLYHSIGLPVSLSTDDPLIFHMTERPLDEEYSLVTHVFGFDSEDLQELTMNTTHASPTQELAGLLTDTNFNFKTVNEPSVEDELDFTADRSPDRTLASSYVFSRAHSHKGMRGIHRQDTGQLTRYEYRLATFRAELNWVM
jgi:AMP deaminase